MDICISKLPEFAGADKDIFRSRIYRAVDEMMAKCYPRLKGADSFVISEIAPTPRSRGEDDSEKPEKGTPVAISEPQFTFEQIVLDEAVKKELEYAISFERVRNLVYDTWGVKRIDPAPKLALNFHGPSGTGKTMAAHALAQAMGKKIIPASYAEIESKYVGDGPKNVKKLFSFASENDALLFIDEADSLLSKRLTNIEHGSEQSLNSMRSQLLIEIEKYSGTVIFATNLAANYDSAFKTRMRSILFKNPDKAQRRDLWQKMLSPPLPLAADVDIDKLAEIEDIVGRDIKNAVVKAAVAIAIDNSSAVTQQALLDAINGIIVSNREMDADVPKPLSETEKKSLGSQIRRKLRTGKFRRVRGSAR